MTRATSFFGRPTTWTSVLALAAGLTVSGCKDFEIPNYQAGSTSDLAGTPSATTVATAAQGLAIGTRNIQAGGSGFGGGVVSTFGVHGREGYIINPTSGSALAPYFESIDRSMGSGIWSSTYAAIRQANIVMAALDNVVGMSDAEKEGIRGWAKTLQAYDLLLLIDVMDVSGAGIDVDRTVEDAPAPIVGRDEVFTRILQLLDEGKTHLLAAGASFGFTPPRGFASFNTPAGLLQVNRAIRARVEVYIGSLANLASAGSGNANFTEALNNLNESFISPTASLRLGAYNTYGTASADVSNPLYDPVPRTLYAHEATITDAQLQANSQPDLRATDKTLPLPAPYTYAGVTVDLKWNIYRTSEDPDPLIRNEELLLLRAEANLALGNTSAAITDINVVRVNAGGLAPLADPYVPTVAQPTLLDELLYNRRYSLLWEGGHRWIDMRRYGLLGTLPKARPGDKIFPYSPLPDAECIPREPDPPGCAIPATL